MIGLSLATVDGYGPERYFLRHRQPQRMRAVRRLRSVAHMQSTMRGTIDGVF